MLVETDDAEHGWIVAILEFDEIKWVELQPGELKKELGWFKPLCKVTFKDGREGIYQFDIFNLRYTLEEIDIEWMRKLVPYEKRYIKKREAMEDLIGMPLKKADKIASQKGYATACFKRGEKINMSEADPNAEYIILIYDDKNKVVHVR